MTFVFQSMGFNSSWAATVFDSRFMLMILSIVVVYIMVGVCLRWFQWNPKPQKVRVVNSDVRRRNS